MSKRKQARPSELVDGLFLSKPWRDHSPEEQEAVYPAAQRKADAKRYWEEFERIIDSVIERRGPESIWIDVKGDSSEVAKIRRPASLSIKEAIPELKLLDACPEVVEYVGAKGGRLQVLVANVLSVEEVEAFASGTRLPSEKRVVRSQTVETAERAKAATARRVAALPEVREKRSDAAADRRERVLNVAIRILDEISTPKKPGLKRKKPTIHKLAGLVADQFPEREELKLGDWKPSQKAASHMLSAERNGVLKGKVQPLKNRSRD